MEYKDYYKILGVPRTASEKEIKSAYRKLARKYHPDVNPGDKGAEDKFKEINEAQAVLTDPEKRRQYDTLGPDWERRMRQGAGTGPQTYTYAGGTGEFSDFFESLFGGRGQTSGGSAPGGFDFDLGSLFGRRRRAQEAQQRGSDVEQPVDIALEEAFAGVERTFTIQSAQTCPTCHGTGLLNDRVCPTCGGSGAVPKTKRLEVKIPAGVREGSRIRVAGEGNPGNPPGDLYLVVRMLPHPRYRREGDDLYEDVDVPVTTLVLGGDVAVPTLSGNVTMRVPEESQNGRTLRLAGQGMPHLKGSGRGNLYVKLHAVLPTQLNPQQRELFTELAKAGV
jgi:DnaJ-class molecular chaperone